MLLAKIYERKNPVHGLSDSTFGAHTRASNTQWISGTAIFKLGILQFFLWFLVPKCVTNPTQKEWKKSVEPIFFNIHFSKRTKWWLMFPSWTLYLFSDLHVLWTADSFISYLRRVQISSKSIDYFPRYRLSKFCGQTSDSPFVYRVARIVNNF